MYEEGTVEYLYTRHGFDPTQPIDQPGANKTQMTVDELMPNGASLAPPPIQNNTSSSSNLESMVEVDLLASLTDTSMNEMEHEIDNHYKEIVAAIDETMDPQELEQEISSLCDVFKNILNQFNKSGKPKTFIEDCFQYEKKILTETKTLISNFDSSTPRKTEEDKKAAIRTYYDTLKDALVFNDTMRIRLAYITSCLIGLIAGPGSSEQINEQEKRKAARETKKNFILMPSSIEQFSQSCEQTKTDIATLHRKLEVDILNIHLDEKKPSCIDNIKKELTKKIDNINNESANIQKVVSVVCDDTVDKELKKKTVNNYLSAICVLPVTDKIKLGAIIAASCLLGFVVGGLIGAAVGSFLGPHGATLSGIFLGVKGAITGVSTAMATGKMVSVSTLIISSSAVGGAVISTVASAFFGKKKLEAFVKEKDPYASDKEKIGKGLMQMIAPAA